VELQVRQNSYETTNHNKSLLLFSTLLFGQADNEFFKKLSSLEGKTFYGKAEFNLESE